jgi:hypothetical protein
MENKSENNTGIGKAKEKSAAKSNKKNDKHYGRTLGILTGLTMIGAGIGYFGNAIGLWAGFNFFFSGWWTLFAIIPCLAGVLDRGLGSKFTFGLLFGIIVLILRQGLIFSMWKLFLPAALIYIGLSMIFRNKPFGFRRIIDAEDGRSYFIPVYRSLAIPRKIQTEDDFNGAEVIAWFSPVTLDLTAAKIDRDVVLYVKAVFAPVTVRVSPDINLRAKKISGFSKLFVEAKNYDDIQNMPVLHINAGCIFNSVTIMN